MAIDRHSLIIPPQPISTLVVGDSHALEFDAGIATLRAMTDVIEVVDLAAAERLLVGRTWCPDLVVLVQNRPGEHAASDVVQLRMLAPWARFIGLLGSWCEGEPRTGAAPPGVIRVYWYDATARFTESISKLASGRCGAWGLPLTAGDDEQLLALACEPAPLRHGLVLLATRHFDSAEALAEACRSRGHAAVWLQSANQVLVQGAIAIVWDGSTISEAEGEELAALRKRFPATPIIAVLDFPRFDGVERAKSYGAASVVARPLLLDDLFWQIAELSGQARSDAPHVTAPLNEERAISLKRIGQSGTAA